MTLAEVSGSQTGKVAIPYALSDVEGDVLDMACVFRTEEGVWQDATVLGETQGIGKGDYGGHVIWDSATDLPEASRVSLIIYDISGRMVQRLVHGPQSAGSYGVAWDGRDERGQPVASGVYAVRMEAGRFRAGRKLVMLK